MSSCKEFATDSALPAHSAFLYHYARLIEIVYALERIEKLLDDPVIWINMCVRRPA